MTEKRGLDVRGLPCPEPADQILEAVNVLADGQYLEVLHHQEPMLLFQLLEKRGFAFVVHKESSSSDGGPCVKMLIWREQDKAARDAAL